MSKRPFYRKRWPYLTLGASLILAIAGGAILGRYMRLDLPDVRALQDYQPPEMSQLLADDGSLVATFAEQRRILIDYDDIPLTFQNALIATEDSGFYRHTGIDFKGILRAAWSDLRHLRLAQGASTLTQQLARNLFLNPDKTVQRKVQEALLALEIERQYTKQEILRFYCNQVYTGHGRYGIEAASRYYFGRTARELSVPEAATLAGLLQRPEGLSPFKHPERALRRRNFVLSRMVDEGFLEPDQAAEAQAAELEVSQRRRVENPAPYFVEEIRRWLQGEYGSSSLYKEGLEVRTTLDTELQAMANRAMDVGLRELDKRQGWRGVQQRVPEGEDLAVWLAPSWSEPIETGRVYDGIVIETADGAATVRVAEARGRLDADDVAWTKTKNPARLFDSGDMIRVRVESIDEEGNAELSLEQEPEVEAALVALDPATGEVKALVGGFDFERSEFDRAIQARRQTGSAFKPLIYAAALAAGRTLADTLLDEPTVFLDPRRPQPYQPENYSNKYYETVTLRTALEKSANISTVKLLDEIGYDAVIQTARKLGITGDMQPFPSLALGAFEASLLELTAAYGTFANEGILVQPHLVREVWNRDGALIDRIDPWVQDAVGPQTAFLMNRVLGGVISDGTGRAASQLGHTLAGKTGTTDDNTDAWFIGYAPGLAVGVWVGFDERRSLGSRETGAQAALPIWQAFMESAVAGRPNRDFERPAGLTIVSIDRSTGLKANPAAGCESVISEVFISGTEPTQYCSDGHHQWRRFPYPFQRYTLNDRGELEIPEGDLGALLASEMEVYLVDGAQRIEAYTNQGIVSLPLRILPGGTATAPPLEVLERYDVSQWVGKDGRAAEILWLN